MRKPPATLRIDRLELPASLAGRPKLKAMIEEELAILLEGSSLSSLDSRGAEVELRGRGNDRETAKRIAGQIFESLS